MTGRITETTVNEMNWISFHYCVWLWEDAAVKIISLLVLSYQSWPDDTEKWQLEEPIRSCHARERGENRAVTFHPLTGQETGQKHAKVSLGFRRKTSNYIVHFIFFIFYYQLHSTLSLLRDFLFEIHIRFPGTLTLVRWHELTMNNSSIALKPELQC